METSNPHTTMVVTRILSRTCTANETPLHLIRLKRTGEALGNPVHQLQVPVLFINIQNTSDIFLPTAFQQQHSMLHNGAE